MPAPHPAMPSRFTGALLLGLLGLTGLAVAGPTPPLAACNNTGSGMCVAFFFLRSLSTSSDPSPTSPLTLALRPPPLP